MDKPPGGNTLLLVIAQGIACVVWWLCEAPNQGHVWRGVWGMYAHTRFLIVNHKTRAISKYVLANVYTLILDTISN